MVLVKRNLLKFSVKSHGRNLTICRKHFWLFLLLAPKSIPNTDSYTTNVQNRTATVVDHSLYIEPTVDTIYCPHRWPMEYLSSHGQFIGRPWWVIFTNSRDICSRRQCTQIYNIHNPRSPYQWRPKIWQASWHFKSPPTGLFAQWFLQANN